MLPVREDERLPSPLPFFGVLAVVLAYLNPGGAEIEDGEEEREEERRRRGGK